MSRYWTELKSNSVNFRITVISLIIIWTVALVGIGVGLVFMWERPSQAQPGVIAVDNPTLLLTPLGGPVQTPVTLVGQGWQPNSQVLIYLAAAEETALPDYASTSVVVDAQGNFELSLVVPANPGWIAPEAIRVIARTVSGELTAQTLFSLTHDEGEATQTPTPMVAEPTVLPATPTFEPTTEPTATSTTEPTTTPTVVVAEPTTSGLPLLTSATDLNIRSGPGTSYPVLGLLRANQSAEVSGVSPDGAWWQIKFSGILEGRGWVAARYATTQNTNNVPVVQPPALPVQPTAVVVIRDWRGEYYNNPTLSGTPSTVRNDVAINFDWGNNAPVAGVGSDNFSVRWTRTLSFPAGAYRFYLQSDDGVRLWLDDILIIDQWHDGSSTTYTTDVTLVEGNHQLRMEYYERQGTAMAHLAWELQATYPDWKGEYFNNPNLSGSPVLVRNDLGVNFGWGPNSPGPNVPADKFSVRWTRNWNFEAGTYRFKVLVDDGARLWVDDKLVLDQWRSGEPKTYTTEVTLNRGSHQLRLEYFDDRYDAQVRLSWEQGTNYPDWKAEYYDNRNLQGHPVLVRNETKIDYNWGSGSPRSGVPVDNFSARWTRTAEFQSGLYKFQVKVDDGVRVWVDDVLVLDSWQDGSTRSLEVERQLSQGQHRLRVEYYERGGDARLEIAWQKKEVPANQPPQANAGGPYLISEGSMLTLNGSTSKDPDGTIVSYEWDFNYNNGIFTVDATGPGVATSYPDGPVTVIVALRVTDNQGASQVATSQVTVQNVGPTVEAGGPYVGPVNNLITLSGTATDAGLIDQTGLSYSWEFGDGSLGSGPAVSHSYAAPGTYTVKLTVTDKDGAQGSDTATVQVTAVNQPPKAVISGPTKGIIGEVLTFSGNSSSDSDGNIVTYLWNFGDGVTGNGANLSHTYGADGTYQVTLTVTDNEGQTHSATYPVQIDLPVVKLPPLAVVTAPVTATVSQTITFDGSASTDNDGSIVSYGWDFGDGTTATGDIVPHLYEIAGTYLVSLTVTDNDGLTTTVMASIEIN